MQRKTISLCALIDTTNAYLSFGLGKNVTSPTPEMRKGAAALLESALHAANAYAGFTYLEPYREGCDDSRRHYFKARHLQDGYLFREPRSKA